MLVNRNNQLLFKLFDTNIQTSPVKFSFKFSPFLVITYTGEFFSGSLQFAITGNLSCQKLSQTVALFFSLKRDILMRNTWNRLIRNSLLRLLNRNNLKLKIANLRLLKVVRPRLDWMPLGGFFIGVSVALRFCRIFLL